jgi:threonine dehydrogenase-like Zn-dependent dehydrogenase
MKAITFHGVGDVRAEDVVDPKVVDATDVLLRITTSAVCGSDLHQYHGRGGGALVQIGAIMGHEFMGVVEETPFTQAIQSVRAGDVVSSVGVYVETSMAFPAREAFFKDLTLKMGIACRRLASGRF